MTRIAAIAFGLALAAFSAPVFARDAVAQAAEPEPVKLGEVDAGSRGNRFTVVVTNTSATATADRVTLALSEIPPGISDVRIEANSRGPLGPNTPRIFTVSFDVEPEARDNPEAVFHFQVNSDQDAEIAWRFPKAVVAIRSAPPDYVPTLILSNIAVEPKATALRATRVKSRVHGPGQAGFNATTCTHGGGMELGDCRDEEVQYSLKVTDAPVSLRADQPFDLGVELRKHVVHWVERSCLNDHDTTLPAKLTVDMSGAGSRVRGSAGLTATCEEIRNGGTLHREDWIRMVLRFDPTRSSCQVPNNRPAVLVCTSDYELTEAKTAAEFLAPDGESIGESPVGSRLRIRSEFEMLTEGGETRLRPFPTPANVTRISFSVWTEIAVLRLQFDYRPFGDGTGGIVPAPYEHPQAPLGPDEEPREEVGVADVGSGTAPSASAGPGEGVGQESGSAGTRPGGDTAPTASSGSMPDATSPKVADLIREWISVAEPPENATEGAKLRYSLRGNKVGSVAGGEIASEHESGAFDPVFLWTSRRRLDSVDHCTMEEYVTARLGGRGIEHCAERYQPILVALQDFTGRKGEAAARALRKAGLQVRLEPAGPAPREDRVGRVAGQAPTPGGKLRKGSQVTLRVFGPYEVPAALHVEVAAALEACDFERAKGIIDGLSPGTARRELRQQYDTSLRREDQANTLFDEANSLHERCHYSNAIKTLTRARTRTACVARKDGMTAAIADAAAARDAYLNAEELLSGAKEKAKRCGYDEARAELGRALEETVCRSQKATLGAELDKIEMSAAERAKAIAHFDKAKELIEICKLVDAREALNAALQNAACGNHRTTIERALRRVGEQETREARARSLFEDGKALVRRGDKVSALAKFAEARAHTRCDRYITTIDAAVTRVSNSMPTVQAAALVPVPMLDRATPEEASLRLRRLGLVETVSTGTPAPEARLAGLVASQDPVAGTMVERGATVHLTLYGPRQPVSAPFRITAINHPTVIAAGSNGDLEVRWSGTPAFPLTMTYFRNGPCPRSFDCVNQRRTFPQRGRRLVFPGALFCGGAIPAGDHYFDYAVVLEDRNGVRSQEVAAPFTCRKPAVVAGQPIATGPWVARDGSAVLQVDVRRSGAGYEAVVIKGPQEWRDFAKPGATLFRFGTLTRPGGSGAWSAPGQLFFCFALFGESDCRWHATSNAVTEDRLRIFRAGDGSEILTLLRPG